MTNKQHNSEKLSPLHELLNTTPSQVDADLLAAGIDPDEAVAAMRRLGDTMASKYATQLAREKSANPGFAKPFPLCEESVAAGVPAYALADASVPTRKASLNQLLESHEPESTMWVVVQGWSMRDIGINDGDHVLVDTKVEPKDGDLVVAYIHGSGQVVKRLRVSEDDGVVLHSANPDFEPIPVGDSSNIRIHGKVIARAGTV